MAMVTSLQGSRAAGQQGSRAAGQQGSRAAGQQGRTSGRQYFGAAGQDFRQQGRTSTAEQNINSRAVHQKQSTVTSEDQQHCFSFYKHGFNHIQI
jgi:hypothetical protein